MGSLTHWEILDAHRIDVLRDIVQNVDIGDHLHCHILTISWDSEIQK